MKKEYAIAIEKPDYFDFDFHYFDDYPKIQMGRSGIEIYIDCNESKKHCRFVFEKLDSIKRSRGEYLPYDVTEGGNWSIMYEVKNSRWLIERYEYEKKHYGGNYEFVGDVDEMVTAYKHLVFLIGEQFFEVICRGFWYETSDQPFSKTELSEDHPFGKLSSENAIPIEHAGLNGYIYRSKLSTQELINRAKYCSQKQYSYGIEFNNYISIDHHIQLMSINGTVTSSLRGHFDAEQKRFDKVVDLDQIKPYVLKFFEEIAERKKDRERPGGIK